MVSIMVQELQEGKLTNAINCDCGVDMTSHVGGHGHVIFIGGLPAHVDVGEQKQDVDTTQNKSKHGLD